MRGQGMMLGGENGWGGRMGRDWYRYPHCGRAMAGGLRAGTSVLAAARSSPNPTRGDARARPCLEQDRCLW